MSLFTATSTQNGEANTSTNPSYIITSTSSATATSDISLDNAQEEASKLAQQVANSTAQNDANIISQTLSLNPTGVIGTYSYLNITFAFQTPIKGQAVFDGLIVQKKLNLSNSSALQITSKKTVYNAETLEPLPLSNHFGTLSTHVNNYGGIYGDLFLNDTLYTSPTPKSVLSNNRISYIKIGGDIEYKIKILTNLKLNSNIPILEDTTVAELNNSITGIEVNDKCLINVHTITDNGNLFTTFSNVNLIDRYSDDYLWDYITLDFSRAFVSGTSKNIYPVTNPDGFAS